MHASYINLINNVLSIYIQVCEIQYDTTNQTADTHVAVQIQFVLNWASIEAKWHFIDAESPIIDYRWAIGNYFRLLFSFPSLKYWYITIRLEFQYIIHCILCQYHCIMVLKTYKMSATDNWIN